jgi:hypothetical protein
LAKSKALPEAPKQSMILRAGLSRTVTQRVITLTIERAKRAYSRFAEFDFEEGPVLAIYEDQGDLFFPHLPRWFVKTFPRQASLGEDQQWLETRLLNNPGNLLLVDLDVAVAPIEFAMQINGAGSHSPKQFAAYHSWYSRLAVERGATMWGYAYRQTQGRYCGAQQIPSSMNNKQCGFVVADDLGGSGKPKRPYLRNFFVISRDARGTWPAGNYLEDLGRSISEYAQGGIVGKCEAHRIRFADKRTTRHYNLVSEHATNLATLKARYGAELVNSFYREDCKCK